ncbi:MAG: hypothetical protein ACYS6W_18140 [Planctomycetota bacterium]|jgi:adenylate kinase family enzyme
MNEKERTVYLTIGFLGSGKSTWAKKFAAEHPDLPSIPTPKLFPATDFGQC